MADKRNYWDHLFGQHGPGLAAFIRRRVRRSADASDLTQELYLRFLRADRAELIRNPEAYLYTVAVNLLREQSVLERRLGRAVDSSELAMDPALVNFRTPEEEVDLEGRVARITEMIDALPAKPRAALVLQYRDGLTYEEIADRLGVTTHAVKKYVMQGLALCRKRLAGLEGHSG
ncbi:MAG TPA: sigma-70 family RNA polymerase sigma factor [Steroidobacter sp.]|uniref:RNA polymerase sigma factor n=1 Tax=Steroidobacter sp. TaxID=1978227 RepID=UPI002EDB0E26